MENKQGSVLIIDDNEEMLLALKIFLSSHFAKIVTEKNPNLIPGLMKENFDLILLDMNFSAGINSGNEGFFWMNEILKIDPLACIVFITAYSDVELAVKAIKRRSCRFLSKNRGTKRKYYPLFCRLINCVNRNRKSVNLNQKQKHLTENLHKQHQFVQGRSPSMQKAY